MCRGLIWDFAWMKKFVFFFYVEGSFFWLPQNDVTMDVDFRSKWQLLQLGMLLHHRRWKFVIVKRWLVVPQRYGNLGFCSLTLAWCCGSLTARRNCIRCRTS